MRDARGATVVSCLDPCVKRGRLLGQLEFVWFLIPRRVLEVEAGADELVLSLGHEQHEHRNAGDRGQLEVMLGHLLGYLRAALPQLRSNSTTLGQEIELAQAYLSIMQMRMGTRLVFSIDVPQELRAHRFPPMLLMSMVENAVKHGLEPQAEGGTIRLEARRRGERVAVTLVDNGRGLGAKIGNGVGLTNLRGRLRALYADNARFVLEEVSPHGARATIEIPFDADEK